MIAIIAHLFMSFCDVLPSFIGKVDFVIDRGCSPEPRRSQLPLIARCVRVQRC
ncbi:MAG: hypothetical protein NZ578_06335 [Candidatus Binatia bacterium]|nr:hypothetical protein [Candidatus Binatia bacterium]